MELVLWCRACGVAAHAGYDQTREHQRELTRQREQISLKLQTLLDLRMDGEITADEYARKRAKS